VFGFGMVLLFAGLKGVLEGDLAKVRLFVLFSGFLRWGSTLRTRDRRVAMFGANWPVYEANMDEFAYP
jgi:hypothetical protein